MYLFKKACPEAEFLDVIGTKVSALLYIVTSANGFYPPPPRISGLKVICNVNIVQKTSRLRTQDYAQKPQRKCAFMNSASVYVCQVRISACFVIFLLHLFYQRSCDVFLFLFQLHQLFFFFLLCVLEETIDCSADDPFSRFILNINVPVVYIWRYQT